MEPIGTLQRIRSVDVLVALAAFGGLRAAVLTRAPQLLEPDDLAYRASIAALAHGHLTLSTAEYQALAMRLGGIAQWTQLADGRWISEKDRLPAEPLSARRPSRARRRRRPRAAGGRPRSSTSRTRRERGSG